MMCHDNCCLKHSHKRLKTEETKRYIRILNQLNPRECSTMQNSLHSHKLFTISRSHEVIRYDHFFNKRLHTGKIILSERQKQWREIGTTGVKGRRMSNRHCMMQAGPFEDLSTPSELSWRPYGNSSNNFKSFKSQVQQQKRSCKSQCVHTTTIAAGAGEPPLRQLGGRDSYEEEEAFGETNPNFGEFSAVSHRPQQKKQQFRQLLLPGQSCLELRLLAILRRGRGYGQAWGALL